MRFKLDEEKALDVLIWWVESSNGSINYREEEAVKKVLEDINYSMENYYQETILHMGGLSTKHLNELVEAAIVYGKKHFSKHRKQLTVALLEVVTESDAKITPSQQQKLERIKKVFGVENLRVSPEAKKQK